MAVYHDAVGLLQVYHILHLLLQSTYLDLPKTMDNCRVDELLKSLEHLQQSIKSLHQYRDAQSHRDIQFNPANRPRPPSVDWSASSLQRVATISNAPPQSAVTASARRLTNESSRSRPTLRNDGVTEREHSPDFLALTSPPMSCNSSEPSPSCVVDTLPSLEKSEEDLVTHLKSIEATDETKAGTIIALADAWEKRDELTATNLFTSFETGEGTKYEHTSYQVYEVDRDGLPTQKHPVCPEGGLDCPNHGDDNADNRDKAVWPILKTINADGTSVGRISILQEPTPLMLAATHLTMQSHFDMDELLSHLVTTTSNKGKTKAHLINRSIEPTPLRQRSFFFVFKYYTVIPPGLHPTPWQPFDPRPLDFRSPDHIDITSCSSILALSLSGPVASQIKLRVKRKTKSGNLYHTFAPWQLLNIQYFPDDHHTPFSTIHSDNNTQKIFLSGPHAFLDALRLEYRDAIKRYTDLNDSITKLITPPSTFMFDVRLRDKLLFEDSHFTYSRRYFWAYNTLGVINEGIKAMISAYLNNFTKDFWEGKHPTLWPVSPTTNNHQSYLAKLDTLRQDLEAAISELRLVHDKNEGTRTEIRSLREQLFSGSSVKESRRAIEQGKNIKILTSVSMVFLPLTFVVGVFSITTLEIGVEDGRFSATLVGVCVPFFLLILVLQSTDTVRSFWGWGGRTARKVLGLKGGVGRVEGKGFGGDRRHLYHHYQQHLNGVGNVGVAVNGGGGVKKTQVGVLGHGHQRDGGVEEKRWVGRLKWRGWSWDWKMPDWRRKGQQESNESTMEKGELGREKRVE